MSERIVTGRDKLGRGGQHVNDGSERSMALVIDDEAGFGVYCHTERSLRANTERARLLLAAFKEYFLQPKEKASPVVEKPVDKPGPYFTRQAHYRGDAT